MWEPPLGLQIDVLFVTNVTLEENKWLGEFCSEIKKLQRCKSVEA